MFKDELKRRTLLAVGLGATSLGGLLWADKQNSASTDARETRKVIEPYQIGQTLYENLLAHKADVKGFRLEGDAIITFPKGRMRMQNLRDVAEGQAANFVFWCPLNFPPDIEVSWDFWPIQEPGLCILFFAATGRKGEDLFDSKLAPRAGLYEQYHHGDINALHVSYFRRRYPVERAFHTCNLRKSYGLHLVSQGADPIPSVVDTQGPYRIRLIKYKAEVAFSINDLPIFRWVDDGITHGSFLGSGKIGFRQMAPLIGEYANFKVKAVKKA
jgi:hypothetical protein